MEKHHLQAWSPTFHNIRQWKVVWQSQVSKICQDLGVKNHYSSPRHLQANGQTKVTNKSLLKIIKTRLKGGKGGMAWGTTKCPLGIKDGHKSSNRRNTIRTDIWHWGRHTIGSGTDKLPSQNLWKPEEPVELNSNLDLIDEVREEAINRMAKHKEAIARYYNRKVKVRRINIGDLVLRNVS